MRTIKLTISYDGTNYVGWQRQPNGVSVQARVEDALAKMTGRRAPVNAAGRTDAGVHAFAQVAHFTTASKIPCEGFVAGLNSMLPDDISVTHAEEMEPGFNSRRDAKGKIYLYRILVSRSRQPLLLDRCWQVTAPIDLAAMKKGAAALVGEHDFASFRASGCGSMDARRRIERIEITAAWMDPACHCEERSDEAIPWSQRDCFASLAMTPGQSIASPPNDLRKARNDTEVKLINIEFFGNGFVRHMIRNIVGTLVDIGKGRMASEDIMKVLKACKREQAGRCAPACGLYLLRVIY